MRSVFYPRLVNGPWGDPALYVRIAHRGEALLFDCGDLHPLGTRERLKIQAVFLSHAHIDHLAGFDSLLRSVLYSPQELTFYGPPGIAEQIGHRLAGTTWNLTEGYPLVLRVREWGPDQGRQLRFCASRGFVAEELPPYACPDGLLFERPGYRVRAIPLAHGDIISLAFCLQEPMHVAIHKEALLAQGLAPGPWLTGFKDQLRREDEASASIEVPLLAGGSSCWPLAQLAAAIAHCEGGMKLCYVTDVSPSAANQQAIVELAAGAHLLAIEATFAHADLERARQRNHLTARLAGTLGRRAAVAKLLLFHHSPRYAQRPALLAAEAAAAFAASEEIEALEDVQMHSAFDKSLC
jgi:ribonuclease Z